MARPEPDPRAHGFLQGWVSNALLWCASTRRLIKSTDLGESSLAMVSLYLCLAYVCLLVGVDGRARLPHSAEARNSCPIELGLLRRWRDRAKSLRDEVLHIHEKADQGRGHSWHWSPTAPFLFKSSIGRHRIHHAEISAKDIEDLLDRLQPWLREHWHRLVQEGDTNAAKATG